MRQFVKEGFNLGLTRGRSEGQLKKLRSDRHRKIGDVISGKIVRGVTVNLEGLGLIALRREMQHGSVLVPIGRSQCDFVV